MKDENFYEILGISKFATIQQIKTAYHRHSLKYHPDKNPNGKERFLIIKNAYETLIDPVLRKTYDNIGLNAVQQLKENGVLNLSAFLHENFGKEYIVTNRRIKSKRINYNVPLPKKFLDDGINLNLGLIKKVTCKECRGVGGYRKIPCVKCYAKGSFQRTFFLRTQNIHHKDTVCRECRGRGYFIPKTQLCRKCHGTTIMEKREVESVFIPPGSKDGDILKFEEKGHREPNLIKGTLYIQVKIDEK